MRIAILAFAAVFAVVAAAPGHAGDFVLFGGKVVTVDKTGTVAQALVVQNGRIAFVGTNKAALARAPRGAARIDLKGAAVLPGFYDAHSHFPMTGIIKRFYVDLNSPPIGRITTISGLVSALSARAASLKPGEWLRGIGYDDTLLAENRHPTREDLDRVSREIPIYVMHISGHFAVANTAALNRAGITASTLAPSGGKIRLDPNSGAPNGVLEEAAMQLVTQVLPPIGDADVIAAIGDANQDYARMGITNAQNGASGLDGITTAVAARERGLLTIRHKIWPLLQIMDEVIAALPSLHLPEDGMIGVHTFKDFADGSIQGLTGFLRDPYSVHAHMSPDYRGYPRTAAAVLTERIRRGHDAGWQIAVHANGDAAIDTVLDAFEAAQTGNPRPDARHIVVHAQMATEDQLRRMKRLGVIPSFFILHTYYWGDRHRDVFIGPERAARISPARSALELGLPFTLHTDTPVVPMEPLRLIWSAATRRTTSGEVLGPDQRIPVDAALRAITINAAYQNFEEDRLGSLEPGKLADLVVLDRSPLDVPANDIIGLRVLKTIVGGATVYQAGPR